MDIKTIIQGLTNGSRKGWRQAASLPESDRMPGDLKFVFSKSPQTLALLRCSHLLKWETAKLYTWSLEFDMEKKNVFRLDGRICPLAIKENFKFITILPYDWQSPITLQSP